MVISSVPAYLDAHNWQQQSSQQPQAVVGSHNTGGLQPPSGASAEGGGGSTGVNKPGSMSERARLAKVPQPETALKCPRCDSTNTKFCYFNNYNLSQPRHFCKTCRRYWTRGGALRNVPVGGGCRRNKRSKTRNRSRSPVSIDRQAGSVSAPSTSNELIGHLISPTSQLPFLPSLPPLSNYGTTADTGFCFTAGTNLPMDGMSGGGAMEFPPIGGGAGGSSVLSTWRLQQNQHFPFLAGLDPPPSGAYSLQGETVTTQPGYFRVPTGQVGSKPLDGFVKTEDTQQGGLNLSTEFSGGNDNQYWPGSSNGWTDLSGFTSSSTSHLL